MKRLSDFISEQLMTEAQETIKSEKDFREAARAKFEEVFGDELDEARMKKTIDGFLEDNKDLVDAGEWGELIGMFNQSFAPNKDTNESVHDCPAIGSTCYCVTDGAECEVVAHYNPDMQDLDEFLDLYDKLNNSSIEDSVDDILAGRVCLIAVEGPLGISAEIWNEDVVAQAPQQ